MIALKDIPVILSIGATVFGGGVAYHGVKTDIAEVSRDYRQHVNVQQRRELIEDKWRYEDRLKKDPEDADAKKRLEETNMMLEENKAVQQQLKGGQ